MKQIFYIISIIFFSFIYSIEYNSSYNFGYDNNILKYSDNENIIFSRYLKTHKSISTKFKILNRATRFSLSFKKNYYFDFSDKSNYSFALKLRQPLGKYRFLDFSYNYINDIYLREYVDVDQGILNYIYEGTSCDFDFSKYSIGFERPLKTKKSKINLFYLYQTQFYNPFFTEFDLEINGYKMKYSKKNKFNKYSISYTFSDARNITLYDNTISTDYMDRGYTEYNLFISSEYYLNENKVGFSVSSFSRKYTSDIVADQLHFNRKHKDEQISVWYTFKHKNKSKFLLKYRKKSTDSEYSWVENLKTFDKVIFEYIFYLKKREFGKNV
tara:strand:- start:16 stop:996 length:981 start_codon:yes stop_codon:yes gene_type:complete